MATGARSSGGGEASEGISAALIKRVSGEYDVEVVRRLNLSECGLPRISGLESCVLLVELRLAHNAIREITGLDSLVALQTLDLSHNRIQRVANLEHLAMLSTLELHGNQITNIDDIATLSGLDHLSRVSFNTYENNARNPVCDHPSYIVILKRYLPHLAVLDGEDLRLREVAGPLLEAAKLEPSSDALQVGSPQRWCKDLDLTVQAADEDPAIRELETRTEDTVEKLQETKAECEALLERAEQAMKQAEQVS